MGQLRADREWELEGLDLHEHGVPGYPELVFGAGAPVSGAAAPRQPLGATDTHRKGTS
jgi:ammonium transporter, Amt family